VTAQELIDTARALVAGDKGLLAMDESNPTCNKRFAELGIPQTAEARRAYRELIVTTPRLGESISGAILYDETIRQQKKDGTPFVRVIIEAGIIPGIKVDAGATDMASHPREKITREHNRQTQRQRVAAAFHFTVPSPCRAFALPCSVLPTRVASVAVKLLTRNEL
jgi:fructose-bisphosphate aldolase class 1